MRLHTSRSFALLTPQGLPRKSARVAQKGGRGVQEPAASWGLEACAADALSDEVNAALRAHSDDDTPADDVDDSAAAVRKRRAQEEAWRSTSEHCLDVALQSAHGVQLLRTGSPLTPSAVASAAVMRRCSNCGSAKTRRPLLVPNQQRVVRFVTTLGGWNVTVPIYECEDCELPFHAHPLQCGCFPGTPVKACQLWRCASHERPIWFDECALEHIVRLQTKSLETSDDAVVEAMRQMCAKVCRHFRPQAKDVSLYNI